MYKYKFSIISAVYNVENYVRSTIDSIVKQSIGFEENVQLILVDDGSPDSSGEICEEYKELYPNNIIVIHKENGGVSSARNEGLKYAEGEFVNFVDSDDHLGINVLESVYDFFKLHEDEVDLISIPIRYFEARRGSHTLNYKFYKGSRVVDLEEDWFYPQMHVASSFIKRSALDGISFDCNLAYAEDAKFVLQVLLKKRKIGLLNSCTYWYRSRRTGGSAIQNSGKKASWYLPVVNHFQKYFVDLFASQSKEMPKFVQMNIMYDLQWRFKLNSKFIYDAGLTDEEIKEYTDIIRYTIKYIDDDVIMYQRNLYTEHKNYILYFKYSRFPKLIEKENDVIACYSSDAEFSCSRFRIQYEFMNIKDSVLNIEGYVSALPLHYENFDLKIYFGNKVVDCELLDKKNNSFCLGEDILVFKGFKVSIPLDKSNKFDYLKIGANINGKDIIFQKASFKRYFPISIFYNNYYQSENWIVIGDMGTATLIIKKNSIKNKLLSFARLVKSTLRKKNKRAYKALGLRVLCAFEKLFKRKPIWLISDRYGMAGDNGEAFFRFMRNEHPEIKTYFVLTKDSVDMERMKKIGPVIEAYSRKHKKYILLSEYILSSQGEPEYFDLFHGTNGEREPVKDIMANKKFVFLQHGVIYNDLSDWLKRANKHFYGFITSAKGEYDSIINDDYGYNADEVWLTGLPRFDRLYDDSQKVISLLPTWRRFLAKSCNRKTFEWTLVDDFEESDYFKFYNSLIQDERLLETMKQYGYKINFVLHPAFRAAADMFQESEFVQVLKTDISYSEIYAKSSLVLTDYSSAVFDFAYMRKPLIYAQFDRDLFYGNVHIVKDGYFDVVRDGFGEVTYDLESTVDCLIEYIKNDCKLKPMYEERIDNFFAHNDKNNCQRIFDKMMLK